MQYCSVLLHTHCLRGIFEGPSDRMRVHMIQSAHQARTIIYTHAQKCLEISSKYCVLFVSYNFHMHAAAVKIHILARGKCSTPRTDIEIKEL